MYKTLVWELVTSPETHKLPVHFHPSSSSSEKTEVFSIWQNQHVYSVRVCVCWGGGASHPTLLYTCVCFHLNLQPSPSCSPARVNVLYDFMVCIWEMHSNGVILNSLRCKTLSSCVGDFYEVNKWTVMGQRLSVLLCINRLDFLSWLHLRLCLILEEITPHLSTQTRPFRPINAASRPLTMLKRCWSGADLTVAAAQVPQRSCPSHFLPLIFWISLELRISMPFLKRPIWPVGAAPKPEDGVFLSLVDTLTKVWTNQRCFSAEH